MTMQSHNQMVLEFAQAALVNIYKDTVSMLHEQARLVQQHTHEPHLREAFVNAIDTLTMKLDCEKAVLSRIQTVGR